MWWSIKGRYCGYRHRRGFGRIIDNRRYLLLEKGANQGMVGKGI